MSEAKQRQREKSQRFAETLHFQIQRRTRKICRMSAKTARREYLQAVAEFERGVRDFARGMGSLLETAAAPASSDVTPEEALPLLAGLGPRKPARRAPRLDTMPDAARSQREAGFSR